jgi:hypothetical protein
MKRTSRGPNISTRTLGEMENLHHDLVTLYDELTETNAWAALVCDGICGIVADDPAQIDSATGTGMRFAVIWLKQRNRKHATTLQAACNKLRKIRGR